MNIADFVMKHQRRPAESLDAYFVRIIREADSDLPGVAEEIAIEAIQTYREHLVEQVEERWAARENTDLNLANDLLAEVRKDLDAANKTIVALSKPQPAMVTVREAEAARLGAFRLAIEKAADMVEVDHCPNMASEAIRKIPDPAPKWSNHI